MSITVNLTPAEEAQLVAEAVGNGLDAGQLVAKVVRDHLNAPPKRTMDEVLGKLHQWQTETKTETAPSISAHELFAKWDEEAAQMTDDERDAEDRLWEDFQEGINKTRSELGMRLL